MSSVHALDGAGEHRYMRVERPGNRVELMRVSQGVLHGASLGDVLDPERENVPSGRDGALDFPPYVRRAVRLGRKDQYENAAALDGADDLLAILRARGHVA